MKVWDWGTGAMKTVTWYFTGTGYPPLVQKRSLDLPGTGDELPPQMAALLPSAEQLRDVIIDSEANDRVSPQDQD